MKGRDRKALDPILYFIHSYTRCTRIHLPSLYPFIGISQHRLSVVCLACLPSSPHPLTHSPLLPHCPKNVRHSSTKQFARLQSCVSSSLMSFRLFSLPSRSFDPERKTFHKHLKSPCRSCIIQNKDHCSQGAFLSRLNPTGLTCLPSCTAYGPTPARSTQDRQLTFKVQYVF
jgi:hypothetical protein